MIIIYVWRIKHKHWLTQDCSAYKRLSLEFKSEKCRLDKFSLASFNNKSDCISVIFCSFLNSLRRVLVSVSFLNFYSA